MDKKEAYSINIFIFKTQLLQEVPLEQLHLPSAFLSGIQTLIVDKAGDQCCVPEHTTTFHMWYTLNTWPVCEFVLSQNADGCCALTGSDDCCG